VTAAAPTLTPEEYLAFEAASPTKHEFVRGEIYAVSGVTDAHNEIGQNVASLLRAHLRGKPCRSYATDVKLRVEAANVYFYPDVFVTCDPRDAGDALVKRSAVLVVEVLSASTAEYDRGDEFADYRKLDSLREYVLVDSREQRVTVHRRNAAGRWELDWLTEKDTLALESVGLEVAVAALYEDTTTEVPVAPRAHAPEERPGRG
jgi:Uma2 family endonuclease